MKPMTPETDPANAVDAAHLLRMVDRLASSLDSAEFNFPAAILQAVEFARHNHPLDLEGMERSVEEGMLQIAFFNEGHTAPSPFIIKAYEAGWRYRIGAGFHKEAGAVMRVKMGLGFFDVATVPADGKTSSHPGLPTELAADMDAVKAHVETGAALPDGFKRHE